MMQSPTVVATNIALLLLLLRRLVASYSVVPFTEPTPWLVLARDGNIVHWDWSSGRRGHLCYERLAKVRRWWLFLTGNVASELGRLVVGIHVFTLFVDKWSALNGKDNGKVSEGVQGSKGRAT